MSVQLVSDIWTQFEGVEVEGLLIKRRRLDYRRRLSDHWVEIVTPIETVLISDNYLSEFAVKVHFLQRMDAMADRNDPMLLRMSAGWTCQGRFMRVDGNILLMQCPVAADNGIPPPPLQLRPLAPRQIGLPEGRKGWQR